MRKEGGMCKLYKNDMNNTQKKMVLIGAALMLLSYSNPSTAAFCPVVRPCVKSPSLGEILQINYYRLDINNCKNVPNWLKESVASPATLSNEEFEQMKTVLQKSLTRYNLKNRSNSNIQIKGLYGVQCLPYIDKEGRKQIWINGFCGDDTMRQNPATEIIMVFDGGSCFFNSTIRMGSSKRASISIHGFA